MVSKQLIPHEAPNISLSPKSGDIGDNGDNMETMPRKRPATARRFQRVRVEE
jgi:hypothetical protein